MKVLEDLRNPDTPLIVVGDKQWEVIDKHQNGDEQAYGQHIYKFDGQVKSHKPAVEYYRIHLAFGEGRFAVRDTISEG
jgi:hypothetical protein